MTLLHLGKDDPGKFFAWERILPSASYHCVDVPINNKIITQINDSDKQVIECQKRLHNFGYDIKIDGKFGKNTAQIVQALKPIFVEKK